MCNACGFPPALVHWTDAGGATPQERLRIRFARIGVLNSLLAEVGLKAVDNGIAPGIQLHDLSGRSINCPTLEDLWQGVEALSGAPYDPLGALTGNPVQRGSDA